LGLFNDYGLGPTVVLIKTYIVKNVSNPFGGLNSPVLTQDLCAPTANFLFSISKLGGVNSLDTKYSIVNYGDTPILYGLNQSQLNSSRYNSIIPLQIQYYQFSCLYKSNCPSTSLRVKLVVLARTAVLLLYLDITILTSNLQVNFGAPSTTCINTNIKFTNTTIAGSDTGCVGQNTLGIFGDPTVVLQTYYYWFYKKYYSMEIILIRIPYIYCNINFSSKWLWNN
jgi:hypothetical protein